MFGSNSRYAKCQIVEVAGPKGKKVGVVKLRRIPYVPGNLTEVKGSERLDIVAHRKYSDGTKFWHVADANSALEANELVAAERSENVAAEVETKFISVPEK